MCIVFSLVLIHSNGKVDVMIILSPLLFQRTFFIDITFSLCLVARDIQHILHNSPYAYLISSLAYKTTTGPSSSILAFAHMEMWWSLKCRNPFIRGDHLLFGWLSVTNRPQNYWIEYTNKIFLITLM